MPAPRRDSMVDELRAAWSQAFSLIEVLIVVSLIGTISAIALPQYMDALDEARVGRAIGDIAAMSDEISVFWFDNGRYPNNLFEVNRGNMVDPYGEAYVYMNIADAGGKGGPALGRKDRFLVPVNSDFDLYSMGKDKETVNAFTGKAAHDDIVRANNGMFIGLAEEF